MRNLEERLAAIDEAIAAIEGGAQSYNVGGWSITRASLGELYKERRQLEIQLAQQNGGGCSVAVFSR